MQPTVEIYVYTHMRTCTHTCSHTHVCITIPKQGSLLISLSATITCVKVHITLSVYSALVSEHTLYKCVGTATLLWPITYTITMVQILHHMCLPHNEWNSCLSLLHPYYLAVETKAQWWVLLHDNVQLIHGRIFPIYSRNYKISPENIYVHTHVYTHLPNVVTQHLRHNVTKIKCFIHLLLVMCMVSSRSHVTSGPPTTQIVSVGGSILHRDLRIYLIVSYGCMMYSWSYGIVP